METAPRAGVSPSMGPLSALDSLGHLGGEMREPHLRLTGAVMGFAWQEPLLQPSSIRHCQSSHSDGSCTRCLEEAMLGSGMKHRVCVCPPGFWVCVCVCPPRFWVADVGTSCWLVGGAVCNPGNLSKRYPVILV